jgi:hypothetical protein
MNIKRLASTVAVCALILSGCTIITPTKTSPTSSPLGSPAATGQTTDVTVTAPVSGTTEVSTTPEITATEVITLGVDVSATAEITETAEVTPTTDVTATTEETDSTTTEAPADSAEVVATGVTSIVVRVRVLNVRSGPGTGYPVVYRLTYRHTAKVTGASANGAWYQIECKEGIDGQCWTSAGSRYVIARK